MATATIPDYLTCANFAAEAGITSSRVRQLLRAGAIRGVKISRGPGAAWLVPRAEIRKLRRKPGLVGRPRSG